MVLTLRKLNNNGFYIVFKSFIDFYELNLYPFDMPELKLQIELIPETAWHNNLRSMLPPEAWTTLRKRVYADFHYRCGICQRKDKLECHELWHYDDDHHIQTLVGLIALCPLCHAVKHLGRSETTQDIDQEMLIKHFMAINNCSRQIFERERRNAYQIFEERSKFSWQVNIQHGENVSAYL